MDSTEKNSQTQAPKKEKRDWLQLLIVPVVLAVLGGVITLANNKQQQQLADEKRKDDVLNSYIQNMKELLLVKEHSLLGSKKDDDVSRTLARTLTLTTLNQLASEQENQKDTQDRNHRKALVLQFLSESQLISNQPSPSGSPIVQLRRANFSGASLSGANLEDDNLNGADLSSADLSHAILFTANLAGAKLAGANLSGAALSSANLFDADLSGTDLSGAKLLSVDLRQAKSLTPEQLEGENPPLLCKVEFPEGFPDKDKFKNRDCNKLSDISPVPASPASSSYPALEPLLASQSWQAANRNTFNLIRDAHHSGEGVTKAAIDQFSCQNLKDIDQLWVHYSNGAFGFSIQRKILESAGHQLVGLDQQNAINAYHSLALQVGWKNSNGWKNVPDFRLDAPRGHLPRIEFTVGEQGQPNNTLVPFDILLRAETCQL